VRVVQQTDAVMVRIGEGINLGQRGERTAARALFAELWARIGQDGDPLHRCALAHSMADVQDDPADELTWDLIALDAADSITDERVRRAGIDGTARGFRPSLHLNLAEAYRKLGATGDAERHLALGRASLGSLDAGGYRTMISEGFVRLAARLADDTVG
jgi:hypothetical protein